MRVSEHYDLGVGQPALDSVDVDVRRDSALFVDPRALLLLPTPWGEESVSLVQSYFAAVLDAIHAGDHTAARRLLSELHEPNDTRLGLSAGRAQGHALGEELAARAFEALSRSEAVRSRLLSDLEDTILLIEGIGPDLISDIATNVIRQPLIHYTHDAAEDLGIALVSGVASGPMWDPGAGRWIADFVELPVADGRRLLLVPKAIVRKRMDYDADEYFQRRPCCRCRQGYTYQALPERITGSRMEYRLADGLVADVALLEGEKLAAIVEIFVTHAVDDRKAIRLDRLPWVELHGPSVILDPLRWHPMATGNLRAI
jgi:hypothetical protein